MELFRKSSTQGGLHLLWLCQNLQKLSEFVATSALPSILSSTSISTLCRDLRSCLLLLINGGCKLTKLDFSDAYLQLELDEESRKFTTHLGLYQYTRLPFGIAAAPAIFQQTMETMLQGLSGVVCYLDDIIVTGKSEAEHLRNLERVLARIQKYGFQVRKENVHSCKTL